MSSNSIYCVYLTIYRGNKLPPFYIGSSSVEKVERGYHGSVGSKQYGKIWKKELKHHPELFETKVLSTYSSREEATKRENYLHHTLNVVRNPLYTNLWYAVVNGFRGYNSKGKMNSMYGKKRPDSAERMRQYNPMHNPVTKAKVGKSLKGRVAPNKGKRNPRQSKRFTESNPMKDKRVVAKMLASRTPESIGKGKIWVANTITKERSRIQPEDLEHMKSSGWIRLANKKPIP